VAHQFATRWFVGVVRSLETKKRVDQQVLVYPVIFLVETATPATRFFLILEDGLEL
jgi:hypothetical protein